MDNYDNNEWPVVGVREMITDLEAMKREQAYYGELGELHQATYVRYSDLITIINQLRKGLHERTFEYFNITK